MADNLGNLGEATVDIRAKFDKFDQDLKNKKSGLDKVIGNLFAGAGVAGAGAAVALTATATKTVSDFVVDSSKQFISFQAGMNEVFTLLPGLTQGAMDQMSKDTLQFAKDLGVLPEEVVPALYQAISAGVPPDNVFSFLETAQKAAVGGVTDLETAVDGISSVVNAYGSDVISAAEASDLMFTAVKLGKTDFQQLSDSLFNVIPTASSLGVSFGDVTAALAAMTAQGTPTSVATTQLRQVLVELSKQGSKTSEKFKEISGQSFPEFIAAGGSVQGALQLMEEEANNSGISISNLFSSVEAGNAALALTGGGTQTFTDNLAMMEESAGATNTAFDQMNTGLDRARERMDAVKSAIMISVGQALEPLLTKLTELAEQALPFVEEVMEEAVPVIAEFAEEFSESLGPALATILDSLLDIAESLGITNDEMSDAESLAALLGEALGLLTPILEFVAGALRLYADAAYYTIPAIKALLTPVLGLKNALKGVGDAAQIIGDKLPDWLTPGSPTPLEIGLRGIGDAMNRLPDFSDKFNFQPQFAGVPGGGNFNQTNVNVDSVSATSNVGSSQDEAIRLTVNLLRNGLKKWQP